MTRLPLPSGTLHRHTHLWLGGKLVVVLQSEPRGSRTLIAVCAVAFTVIVHRGRPTVGAFSPDRVADAELSSGHRTVLTTAMAGRCERRLSFRTKQ